MRAILAGRTMPVSSLFMGGFLAMVYVLLACWFFKATYRHAVRKGLIARYSAETLT
jgi:ABC-2 type transport system permease protein